MVAAIHLMKARVIVNYDLQTGVVFVYNPVAVRGCLIFLIDVD